MPILNKPEQIVLKVLSHLRKTRDAVVDHQQQTEGDRKNMLSQMFQGVQNDLEKMSDLLSQVKSMENSLIERFRKLERTIDDEVFTDNQRLHIPVVGNLAGDIKSSADPIVEKLKEVSNEIQHLRCHISGLKLELKAAADSSKHESSSSSYTKDLDRQEIRAYREWPPLIDKGIHLLNDHIGSFWRSCDKLDSESQFCLVSLSIFPKNSAIKKRLIIHWWTAEGFIDNNHPRFFTEDVGDRVFQELINRRFIHEAKVRLSSNHHIPWIGEKQPPFINSFTVHPWIRLLLILLAKEAQLFDFKGMGRPTGHPTDIHGRAFLMSDLGHENPENLVSVFNINQQYLKFSADWLSRLKKVEFLQLGRWRDSPKHHIEIEDEKSLEGLSALKNLRYLFLRGISRIFSLPQSLTQLISLEVLDLKACHNLEKLPPDISSLRNLTHLDISECYLLESIPGGIEKLSKLQVLKGFVVGASTNKSRAASCKVRDLANLTQLRKLSIFMGAKAAAADVIKDEGFENLEKIVSLRSLTISWRLVSSSSSSLSSSSFKLPAGLEKLDLQCIPEAHLPEWADLRSLKQLRKLYIRGGQLQSLRYGMSDRLGIRILRLKYLKHLSIKDLDLRTMFPHAFYLEVTQCQDKDDYMLIKAPIKLQTQRQREHVSD